MTLACQIRPEYFAGATPLHFTINLNGQPIFSQYITDTVDFAHELSDDPGQHCLEFVMSGKTFKHSPIDPETNTRFHCQLHIDNISFDGIDLDNIFRTHSRYTHSHNDPNGDTVTQPFHGNLGCNGQVLFEFETPMYLWLLENM